MSFKNKEGKVSCGKCGYPFGADWELHEHFVFCKKCGQRHKVEVA